MPPLWEVLHFYIRTMGAGTGVAGGVRLSKVPAKAVAQSAAEPRPDGDCVAGVVEKAKADGKLVVLEAFTALQSTLPDKLPKSDHEKHRAAVTKHHRLRGSFVFRRRCTSLLWPSS